ncbi:amidohydrolase family protein [Aquimarina aquimarini]|uniref:amidohydrolase family protein n=1 Tax=Aquimarina aquimarini TaxID=1191734 RepID=UPI001F43F6A3|nr:amidohydrolase family protein [Aquimarina aquimarini]
MKAYNLNREVYFAVADESKKQNIPMIGHLASELSLEDLYHSGQSQLAHVEEITKATIRDFGGLGYDNTEEYITYLRKNANGIAIKLKENNITISSTIWLMESLPKQKFDLHNFLKSIELPYQNPGILERSKIAKGWLPGNNNYENSDIKNDPDKIKKSQLFWKTYVQAIHIMTKALADNQVTIIAGTDSNTAGVVAGFSLHDELESLSKSGLSTTQVLQAATLAPAKWMQSDAGKIEVGYRADLVLLEKNPIEDIRNTKSIHTIITNGRLLGRKELDKILQSIKEVNNKSRKKSIDKFVN